MKLSDPDISKADRFAVVAVRLQLNRCGVVLLVGWPSNVQRLALQLEVVLHEDAVKKDRDVCRCFERAVAVESWRSPHYVVALPLTGLSNRIHQRNALLVDAASLTVNVSLVVIRIENLQLISGVARAGGGQKYSAIAACLTAATDVLRNLPFEVELIVLERSPGLNVPRSLIHGHHAIGDDPFRW